MPTTRLHRLYISKIQDLFALDSNYTNTLWEQSHAHQRLPLALVCLRKLSASEIVRPVDNKIFQNMFCEGKQVQ